MNDREEKILALWKQGYSTAMIAKTMEISKNAICGAIFRMRERGVDIPKRGSHTPGLITVRPPKVAKPKSERPKREGYGPRFHRLFERAVDTDSPPKIAKKPIPKPTQKNVGFWRLTAQSCRYVVNDGRPEQFIFCGAPQERGPYCAEHAAICYMPPKVPNSEYQRANARFK